MVAQFPCARIFMLALSFKVLHPVGIHGLPEERRLDATLPNLGASCCFRSFGTQSWDVRAVGSASEWLAGRGREGNVQVTRARSQEKENQS